MRQLEELVAESPTFAALAPAHLTTIVGCAVNQHAAAGEMLFREGTPADRFFLIREGRIALEIDAPGRGPLTIETLQAGDVVGWSWLFEPYRWHLDGRAVSSTGLVAFDGACLRAKCEADHELGYALMQRFAECLIERLEATQLQLTDVYGHPRVA
jgi:CRP-like cAMP-binding protein